MATTYVFTMRWYEKIRVRREELGLSQADLAKAVDISQAAINKIENGGVNKSKFLPRIAKKLGLPLADLDSDFDNWNSETYPQNKIQQVGYRLLGDANVTDPRGDTGLFATHERSDGNLLIFDNPVGSIQRPPFLAKFGKLQALLIQGDLMAPELEHGDVAFGAPELEPAEDTTCVFLSLRYKIETAHLATIRRVIGINENSWNVRYWKEKKREDSGEILLRSDWICGMRIVAKYYGRFMVFGDDMSGWLNGG